MVDRNGLVFQLNSYQTSFADEEVFIKPFLQLLKEKNCFERTHLPGHITGSSWIVDENHEHVLLVHHVKLNKWLQPGGHADGDENIWRVALREAEEETGIKKIHSLNQTIFDLDIHSIPARKEMPEHLHYDIRFLLQCSRDEQLVVSAESNEVKWIRMTELHHLTQERSVLRMMEKVNLL